MTPVRQRVAGKVGDPVRGDCFRCCVASLLHRPYEEVPHFVQLEAETGRYHLYQLNDWLRAEGYPFEALMRRGAVHETEKGLMWLDGRREGWGLHNPGWWIGCVKSKRFEGQHHVVVMHEDRVAFDPSDLTGTPEYDERPYELTGWHYLFIAPEPWRIQPRAFHIELPTVFPEANVSPTSATV